MAIKTAQGLLRASDKGALRMRQCGIVRLGRPGTLAMALAVVAFILVACGGGPAFCRACVASIATRCSSDPDPARPCDRDRGLSFRARRDGYTQGGV